MRPKLSGVSARCARDSKSPVGRVVPADSTTSADSRDAKPCTCTSVNVRIARSRPSAELEPAGDNNTVAALEVRALAWTLRTPCVSRRRV